MLVGDETQVSLEPDMGAYAERLRLEPPMR